MYWVHRIVAKYLSPSINEETEERLGLREKKDNPRILLLHSVTIYNVNNSAEDSKSSW